MLEEGSPDFELAFYLKLGALAINGSCGVGKEI